MAATSSGYAATIGMSGLSSVTLSIRENIMSGGVFLGLTTVDILSYVSRYPCSNEKINARCQLVYGGGPAANAAVAYAALGHLATLVTGLGKQPLATLARDDLKAHAVDIIDMAAEPGQLPVLSAITVDESSGDRSVVYTNTENRMLKEQGGMQNILAARSVLLLDGYYLPQAIQLAEMAKKAGVSVVLDGGSWKDGLEMLLPFVDYAICSENFFPPGCGLSSEVVDFLQLAGIGCICISYGGSPLYAVEDGVEKDIPVKRVEVLDTLGAGDILHGAFCHFIQDVGFFDSLKLAAEVASDSCRFRGTRTWIEQLDSTTANP